MVDSIDENNFQIDMSSVISKQNRMLESRRESTSHGQYIKNTIKLRKDDDLFVNLVKRVFAHHDTQNFNYVSFQDVNINSQESISRYFHHHGSYYVVPDIVQGQDAGNPKIDYAELFERICHTNTTGSDQNITNFLVGGVGIGKTTFICNFISRNIDNFRSRGIAPVKINLDVSISHEIPDKMQLIEAFKRNIISSLVQNGFISQSKAERLVMDCRILGEANLEVLDVNFAHLVNLLRSRHNISVALFIDNIDYLYHLGDRGFFAPHGDIHPERKVVREAHNAIFHIIDLLWRNTSYQSSRLGLPVVLACRRDTISFLTSKQHEVPIAGIEGHIFSLNSPNIDRAQNVVEARFDLMVKLSEKISEPAKAREFISHSNQLKGSYSARRPAGDRLLNDLWKLSRKGLRDLINQISEYSWLEFLDEKKVNLNARFTQQYYPSMLAYMLAGYRRYTQFSGNVPNIYLINASAPSNELGVPKDFKDEHLYTIWLKRLILSYLRSRSGYTTTSEDVISMFCGKNRRAYSENLVRYVMSSLFEVPTAELIEADIAADGSAGAVDYVKHIELTERGAFLLEECANSFKYLQLSVDDWKLMLPTDLHRVFSYVPPDYSYLVADHHEYGEALDKVLVGKGAQTFHFAVFLEEMLKFEKRVWPKVFERLDGAGVHICAEGEISEQVKREITLIHDSLKLKLDLVYLKPEAERRNRAVFRASLERIFEPCLIFRKQYYSS